MLAKLRGGTAELRIETGDGVVWRDKREYVSAVRVER